MQTFLIIVGILAIIAGIYFVLIKTGKIGDRDGDYIADEIEDTIDDVKDEVNKAKATSGKMLQRVIQWKNTEMECTLVFFWKQHIENMTHARGLRCPTYFAVFSLPLVILTVCHVERKNIANL